MKTALYLIPVTLGETEINQVLPSYNHDVIVNIKHFIVENIRSARRFLKKVEKNIDIDELTFYELNRHTDRKFIGEYLAPLSQKQSVGIISEAGCPAIADPGADVVAIAQSKGFDVVPLVGPSSIIMSVMASGFNGQSFAFNGYLPVENAAKIKALKKLENKISKVSDVIKDEENMMILAKNAIKEKMSVRALEKAVKEAGQPKVKKEKGEKSNENNH